MGLIECARRLQYVYGWRLRHWWLDTDAGARCRVAVLCVAVLVAVAQVARLAITVPHPGAPAQAIVWWVVQLIIAVISALISYALRPKVEPPKPVEGEAPTVEDGQSALEVFGEVWIEDEFILAHKVVGREKIKAKGGK